MKGCQDIQELLPLWAGDDLPAAETEAVTEHLGRCPGCARLAESWRADLMRIRQVAGAARPVPLDADRLQAMIARARQQEAAALRVSGYGSLSWRVWGRLAAVLAMVALGVAWFGREYRDQSASPGNPVELRAMIERCLQERVPLTQWQAIKGAGIVTVWSRRPGQTDLQLAACIESPDLARLPGYPWLEQRTRRWARGPDGPRELLIAACTTGDLDRGTRRRLQRSVLEQYAEPRQSDRRSP